MNIFIIATICRESGALSIYNQFMSHLSQYTADDFKYFVVIDPCTPKPLLKNVKYIEKSTIGIRRVWFDNIGFKLMCKKYGLIPDVVFSLNNTAPRANCMTISYYHQSLTLYPYPFSFFNKQERKLLLYSKFYYYYVKTTLKWTNAVIAQTHIIQRKFSERFRFPEKSIYVAFPDVSLFNTNEIQSFAYEKGTINFLYPATRMRYKEHTTLAESLNKLGDKDVKRKMRIHLTLRKGEHSELEKLIVKYGLQKQFVFHGPIPHEQLLSIYKTSDGLLFPSTIETIGLPLLEAAAFGLPVLANDLDYVKDVLKNYEGLKLVPLRDYYSWGEAILKLCNDKTRYNTYQRTGGSDWPKVLQLILGNNG